MSQLWINEVSPRDGLQHEPVFIPTEEKIALVERLAETGVNEIEVTAFVSPQWVPQLADAEKVCQKMRKKEGVLYSALVPNEKGLKRALSSFVDKIAIFTATSESFTKKNINCTIQESFKRFLPVVQQAKEANLLIRGYISTSFHCPYEGFTLPEKTLEIAEKLFELGIDELSFGDTTGRATPDRVRKLLDLLLKKFPVEMINLHFHDTYGLAIANALTAYQEYNITKFDASAGGLGGCPYAKSASGNVATEDLLFALASCGAKTSADPEKLVSAILPLEKYLGRKIQSRFSQACRQEQEKQF